MNRATVAQSCTLLFRRFAIGRTQATTKTLELVDAPQNAILRYSRVQLCATALPRLNACAKKDEAFLNQSPRPRPHSFAFTLIELLVVMAIIALLAALLFPALSSGKRSAQRVRCVGHLRQLGLAAQMYWDDQGGKAFPWRGAATNSGQVYWFGWLQDGVEGGRAFDASLGVLFPYLQGRGVEVCPSFRYTEASLKLKATGASYGFGYNLGLSSPVNQPAVNVQRLARPAGCVLLADSAQINTFQPPASPDHPMIEEFYYLNTNEATVHFRHQKVANAVFCDGHVAPELPLAGSLDLRLPEQTIGRFRTEILLTD